MSEETSKNSPIAELYLALRGDILVLIEKEKDSAAQISQSYRRHLIRAVAAFIEAMTYQLRQVILHCLEPNARSELFFALKEQQIDIGNNGIIQSKRLRTGSIALIKFSLRTFDDLFGTDLCPDFDTILFRNLVDTFSVRDRLMHPKTLEDLAISDEEFNAALDAFSLIETVFGNTVSKSNEIIAAKLRAIILQLEEKNKNGESKY
jgi:hypothetical protein